MLTKPIKESINNSFGGGISLQENNRKKKTGCYNTQNESEFLLLPQNLWSTSTHTSQTRLHL